MTYHLALAFRDEDGRYSLHAAATLLTVCAHTSAALCVHILHDADLPPQGRRALEAAARQSGREMRFHLVPELPPELRENMPPAFGPGAFYRYWLPELPELAGEERLLYLDCDICALMDVTDFWQAADEAAGSGRGPALWGVRDAAMSLHPAYARRMGLRPADCLNSGVLLLHLPRLRRLLPSWQQAMRQALLSLPAPSRYPDQDALNVLCRRLPHALLPERFNYQMHVAARWEQEPGALAGRLLHYCGRKPWCVPAYRAAQPFLEQYGRLAALLSGEGAGE
ncbi:glycosyltransferase [uncultured Desulfovibrio sp.]|uniref:glycosyltransferase family 8 protein n=1 Tax=uncultured Desulfovibrio sp. TaxID=167968 RepID=UPI0026125055|nr:glycosyltransferase [uncultured Desulfovibrio sp.]